MNTKLWQKNTPVNEKIEVFTTGNDRELDVRMAYHDVLGSLAHITMLYEVGLLQSDEFKLLQGGLKKILHTVEAGDFRIEMHVEDVHSQVELQLTRDLGEVGKRIHAARSRNDQVLVDLKLFFRAEIEELVQLISELFETLTAKSEQYKNVLLPGYTHWQVAMPSSFGLWFGAYAETLCDDVQLLQAVYKIVNQNPLGSAAGYGSSLPINRARTTELLGFADLNYNVVHAQMGRGKTEHFLAFALAAFGHTLAKFALDACIYLNQNFDFIGLPAELTTGSSIMPHKKNPDVFELIRAKCNRLQNLPGQVSSVTTNMPSGYHRDYQLLKEIIFPALTDIKECIEILSFTLKAVTVRENILADEKYKYLFTVEAVNALVSQGVPFRDAYKKIGEQVENETFIPPVGINHTHEGSIGNLCTAAIKAKMEHIVTGFLFNAAHTAIENLKKK